MKILLKSLPQGEEFDCALRVLDKFSYFQLMKIFFLSILVLNTLVSLSQIPKSGTYIFKYCDLEYENGCYATCKVVIRKDSIVVYATKEL